MDKEYMLYQIQRFIDIWDGTAIGASVKNMLDNTESDEGIEDLYNDLKSQGRVD